MAGRRPELLDETVAEIEAAGGTALAVACDLSDLPEAQPPSSSPRWVSAYGRLDAVVNNAGTCRNHPFAGVGTRRVRRAHGRERALSLLPGAGRPALPASIAGGGGGQHQLVVWLDGAPGAVGLRHEQGRLGVPDQVLGGRARARPPIRVNAIAPGPVDTPIHATWADDLDEAYAWLADQVPLGRIATAPELGWWIATLIAPGSSWVTGAVIPVDGGQVLDSR